MTAARKDESARENVNSRCRPAKRFDPEGLYVARFSVPLNGDTVAVRGGRAR